MAEFGSGFNLPPGVYEKDLPGWNEPDPIECDGCGEDVMPGDRCEHCGTEDPTLSEADARAEAEIDRAEREMDERRLDG